ncbi:MAG: SRPBCC domain-containing protein [Sandaracinus sp.]
MHTIDEQTLTLAFERTLAAPREDVFEAWTRPERISDWWDPTGARLASCEIDLRVGGSFRFVNVGHSPPFEGQYVVIDRPGRLVFESMGSVGTVTLESRGATTRMHVTIRCASKEHLAHFVQLGVATGTDRTLDNLVRYVASPTASHAR